jgi:regulator of sigma E protease
MNNWYLLAAIPVFGLLVLVHEFGHFITAKWAGIRVEEFGLGFPPNIVGFRKRDQGGWEVIWFGRHRDPEISSTQNPFSGTSGGVTRSNSTPSNHTLYSLNLLPIGGFVRMPGENGDVTELCGETGWQTHYCPMRRGNYEHYPGYRALYHSIWAW